MAYNSVNKWRMIARIQDITLDHTRRGITQEWVYENVILPTFFISKRTYYNYLSMNAKRELSLACQV